MIRTYLGCRSDAEGTDGRWKQGSMMVDHKVCKKVGPGKQIERKVCLPGGLPFLPQEIGTQHPAHVLHPHHIRLAVGHYLIHQHQDPLQQMLIRRWQLCYQSFHFSFDIFFIYRRAGEFLSTEKEERKERIPRLAQNWSDRVNVRRGTGSCRRYCFMTEATT